MDHTKANHGHGAHVVLGNGEREMNLTKDWIRMGWDQRIINLFTRPFGWDVIAERHRMDAWQWGLDRPTEELNYYDLWVGPFQISFYRM